MIRISIPESFTQVFFILYRNLLTSPILHYKNNGLAQQHYLQSSLIYSYNYSLPGS